MQHELQQRSIDGETVWVFATKASNGQAYLFYYAYDARPESTILRNLNRSSLDEATNLHLNYVPDHPERLKILNRTRKNQIGRLLRVKGE